MVESKVYLMDCIEGMKQYPDKYFDLSCVDPPYGIDVNKAGWIKQKKQNRPHSDKNWDSEIPPPEYFIELFRVSKEQIIWGGNYFTDFLPPSRCFFIWDKVCRMDQADCEMAWCSFDKSARIFTYAKGNESGFAPKLKGPDRAGINIHPTQKPIALYKWIFKNYATEGQRILDTHLGSQSSRIAADKAGLDFTGFEIDAEYFEAGCKRYNDYKKQLTLQFT